LSWHFFFSPMCLFFLVVFCFLSRRGGAFHLSFWTPPTFLSALVKNFLHRIIPTDPFPSVPKGYKVFLSQFRFPTSPPRSFTSNHRFPFPRRISLFVLVFTHRKSLDTFQQGNPLFWSFLRSFFYFSVFSPSRCSSPFSLMRPYGIF